MHSNHALLVPLRDAVPSGRLAAVPLGPPVPRCTFGDTSYNCTGFAGSQVWNLGGAVGVIPWAPFPLNMDTSNQWSTRSSCAFAPSPFNLSALAGTGANRTTAFDAAFAFAFNSGSSSGSPGGLTFALTQSFPSCGGFE